MNNHTIQHPALPPQGHHPSPHDILEALLYMLLAAHYFHELTSFIAHAALAIIKGWPLLTLFFMRFFR